MAKRIGVLTCENMPDLLDYDKELAELLRGRGAIVEPLVWEDDSIELRNYDFLIFRTTWGYHHKTEKFIAFLDKLEKSGVKVENPVSLIRENLHKFYLKELREKGVKIIPTEFISMGESSDVAKIARDNGWDKYILKPAISAGSSNTHFIDGEGDDYANECAKSLLETNDILVQKFLPEVMAAGEYSTIFLSDEFHYTVNKRPAEGDFRVQLPYGGVYTRIEPPEEVLRTSKEIYSIYSDRAFYVRVDGIYTNGEFLLMEVEMIEPDLYMNLVPEAIEYFAAKIANATGI